MPGQENNQQFLLGLFGGIAVIAVIGLIIMGVVMVNINNGNEGAGPVGDNNQPADNTIPPATGEGPATVASTAAGIRTFSEKAGAEICTEDGKPVVYLFSTTWCPHCKWISSTFDSLVQGYVDAGKIVAYHWEVDINDDMLTSEKESSMPSAHQAVYREFNPGGSIPTFVFGCKYFRVGNGYESQDDLAAETAEFEAVLNDLLQ
jgi:thiol-disulfide isomerase/thioredoxin